MTVRIFTGADIGYNACKFVTKSKRVQFPSLVGSPTVSAFGETGEPAILEEPYHKAIGAQAIEQSGESIDRRLDRDWIGSEKWKALTLFGLTEITASTSAELTMVMGLPVRFFSDAEKVQEGMLGKRPTIKRAGRNRQTLTVARCIVMPQPFGALYASVLDDKGRVVNQDLRAGRVGVIDVGGLTTNFVVAQGMKQVNVESDSIPNGGWKVVTGVANWLDRERPGLRPNVYALVPHVQRGFITDRNERLDLTPIIAQHAQELATAVIGKARELWNGSRLLNAILITGGGSHIIGSHLLAEFPGQARIVKEDPVFCNALGFWRYAQALSG